MSYPWESRWDAVTFIGQMTEDRTSQQRTFPRLEIIPSSLHWRSLGNAGWLVAHPEKVLGLVNQSRLCHTEDMQHPSTKGESFLMCPWSAPPHHSSGSPVLCHAKWMIMDSLEIQFDH